MLGPTSTIVGWVVEGAHCSVRLRCTDIRRDTGFGRLSGSRFDDRAARLAQRAIARPQSQIAVRNHSRGDLQFPRPVGAAIPEPVTAQLASLDVGDSDLTGSVALRALLDLSRTAPREETTAVNRSRKGDRLRTLAEQNLQNEQAITRMTPPPASESPAASSDPGAAEVASMTPAPAETAEAKIDDLPIDVAALPPSSEREPVELETTSPAAAPRRMLSSHPRGMPPRRRLRPARRSPRRRSPGSEA